MGFEKQKKRFCCLLLLLLQAAPLIRGDLNQIQPLLRLFDVDDTVAAVAGGSDD